MPRPSMLGVVGDSAAGKTTITRGLVGILGEDQVTHVGTDDYHRYDRKQRADRQITPLHPDCNYMDIMAQHLGHLRDGQPILKPVYGHSDGTFGAPVYVAPQAFVVVEGLLGYHTEELREAFDVRVYLSPPEELRRKWKVQRDCTRRGYTTDQVLAELDRREPDSEAFIRPQRRFADLVVSFKESRGSDQEHLDAELMLCEGLPHPDLSAFVDDGNDGITAVDADGAHLHIPGDLAPERAAEIEEAIWDRMHFATHLRSQRLGEFTVGSELHRSHSLGLVQLIILYHFTAARAAISMGSDGTTRSDNGGAASPDAEQGPAQPASSGA